MKKSENTVKHAKRFVNNIDKMRNPHIRDCVSLEEKYGSVEDYSQYQEQIDLKRYYSFMNSSAYDDIRDVEFGIPYQKKLTLDDLRLISSQHDD